MEATIRAMHEQIAELSQENAFLKVDLKIAKAGATQEPTVPLGLVERLAICEHMLGIASDTEIPAINADPVRYGLPDGHATNSCEHARLAWRTHCYAVKEQMLLFLEEHVRLEDGDVREDLVSLVRGLTPTSQRPEPQKAAVVNSEPGQTGADVMAQMVNQAQQAHVGDDGRALAAADSAASEMNESHE